MPAVGDNDPRPYSTDGPKLGRVIVVPDNVSTIKVSTKDHVQGVWNDGKEVIHLADVAPVCNSKCGVGDSNNCCHGERSTFHVVAASLTKY